MCMCCMSVLCLIACPPPLPPPPPPAFLCLPLRAAYMAPELVSDGRVIETDGVAATQVDVYSFAILLYTFTTGLKPYRDLKTVNM